MGKIPVGATIAHAYRFAFKDFLRILGVMWIPMLVMWVPSILMQSHMIAMTGQVTAQGLPALGQLWFVLLPLYIVAFILLFMQVIGIARLALGLHQGSYWYYFSLDKRVWRLIASFLILTVLIVIGWLVVILGSLLFGFLLRLLVNAVNNTMFGGVNTVVEAAAAVVLWCGYVYCLVRLTFLLTPVVAAEEPEFSLARAWTLGKGNFWRMFLIIMAGVIPFLILEMVLIVPLMMKGLASLPPHATPEQADAFHAAMNAHTAAMIQSMFHYWYIVFPAFLALTIVFYGFSIGAQCFAYRAITASEPLTPIAGD